MFRFIKILAVLLVLPVSVKADDLPDLPKRGHPYPIHSAQIMLKGEIIYSEKLYSGPMSTDGNTMRRSAFYHLRITDGETIKNSNGFIQKGIYICEVVGVFEYDDAAMRNLRFFVIYFRRC